MPRGFTEFDSIHTEAFARWCPKFSRRGSLYPLSYGGTPDSVPRQATIISMSPEKQALIDYLKNKTGGALMMTPKELAVEIRVSEKQQSKLRQEKRFPIPHKDFGRSVQYSINAIADFLLTGETNEEKAPEKVTSAPSSVELPTHKKARTGAVDLSQMILLNSFVVTLEEQLTNIESLHGYFTDYIKAKSLSDSLESKLARKEEVPARKRHVIP